MEFSLNETERLLQSSAREFLRSECPGNLVRAMERDAMGFTPNLWQKMAHMGWLGLPFPEEYSGEGRSFVALCVLLEEMARVCLPGPYRNTVVLCGLPILEFGSPELKRAHLPLIATGDRTMSLALTEPNGGYDVSDITLEAIRDGSDFKLTGTKILVPYAQSVDFLLVAARMRATGKPRIAWFVVPTNIYGLTKTSLRTIAESHQCQVTFHDVHVGPESLLGMENQGDVILQRVMLLGAASSCALMLGGVEAALDLTVAYAKQRTAFGQPIGSFQAIQHHCANIARDVEGCRHITYQAAWRLAEGLPAQKEVFVAKAFVSAASQRIAILAHQSHGAIGFTNEYDLQLYTRRNKEYEISFGDATYCSDGVAELLGI